MDKQQHEANIRFGRELRRVRRLTRYTQHRLAGEVGVSHGHIGNIENGKRTPDLRLVAELDRALGAEGRLERLWGNLTGDGDPVWLDDLGDMEQKAVSIMECQTVVFPSLIQTEAYARAIAQATSPWATKNEVENSVKARMRRVERFLSSDAPVYRAVIPRTLLSQTWRDNGIIIGQLARVVDLIEKERISIQVIDSSPHPGMVGPFKLIASHGAPDVVYAESAEAGRIIDDPAKVHRYRLLLGDLQAAALTPTESLQLLRDELERLRRTHD